MIRFSANSWHYRLVNSTPMNPSHNLCQYFWQIPEAIIFWLMIMVAVFCILMFLSSPLWLTIIFEPQLFFIATLASVVWCAILIGIYREFVPYWIHRKIEPKYWFKRSTQQRQREPSLIVEKIKAVKNKVCPRITFD